MRGVLGLNALLDLHSDAGAARVAFLEQNPRALVVEAHDAQHHVEGRSHRRRCVQQRAVRGRALQRVQLHVGALREDCSSFAEELLPISNWILHDIESECTVMRSVLYSYSRIAVVCRNATMVQFGRIPSAVLTVSSGPSPS